MPDTQTDVLVCLHNVRISYMIIKLTSYVGFVGGNLSSDLTALDEWPLLDTSSFILIVQLLYSQTTHDTLHSNYVCIFVYMWVTEWL